MTKDEIKQLIAGKIAGQGSAVDVASALPAILNGIIDAVPEEMPTIFVQLEDLHETFPSFAKMADELEITEKELTMIMAGKCKVKTHLSEEVTLFPAAISPASALYGGADIGENMGASIVFVAVEGNFAVDYSEM